MGLAAFGWQVRPQPKPRVIGVLTHGEAPLPALDGFREGMAALGREEGGQVVYRFSGPQPHPEDLRAEAERLVAERVDLVLALSTPAAQAALAATRGTGVPLVFAPASDPIAAGLVDSISRPGRPVTGVTFVLQEPRRLEWLAELLPGTRTAWVPYNPEDPSPRGALERLTPLAARLELTLVPAPVRNPAELAAALAAIPPEAQAILLLPDVMVASNLGLVLEAAARRHLPVSVPHREGVAAGALFSWGFHLHSLGIQAARLADQILAGTPAGDLPVETADMKLAINVETAARLGLALPEHALRHAVIYGRREH